MDEARQCLPAPHHPAPPLHTRSLTDAHLLPRACSCPCTPCSRRASSCPMTSSLMPSQVGLHGCDVMCGHEWMRWSGCMGGCVRQAGRGATCDVVHPAHPLPARSPHTCKAPSVAPHHACLLNHCGLTVVTHAGVSGAGRSAKESNLYCEIAEGINSYRWGGGWEAVQARQYSSTEAAHHGGGGGWFSSQEG